MRDLKGKGALVTGAANGIGLGICRALAGAGVDLVLADIERDALERARAEIAALGVRATALPLDVSDRDAVMRGVADVTRALPKLHILVNNAGINFGGSPLLSVEPPQWAWIIGVNVMGAIHCLNAFVPLIRAHGEGGHIVNTASIGGLQVNPVLRNGPYAMSKYAVVATSETLALDLEGSGIGVSVFCPALVATTLGQSSRRRPAQFGGGYEPPPAPRRQMPTDAITPDAAGARVLHAIRHDEFFVFTHPDTRSWIEARHERIMAGFDQLDRYLAGNRASNARPHDTESKA
jgi:NAD(P)-dependent dehydrogenase (short-subunit alcohol dehydrogenase family)